MKVYLLEWHFSDGYNHSNGVLGVYATEEAAEAAGNSWLADADVEYETCTVKEVEVHA